MRTVMASLDTQQLNETFELLKHQRRRFVLYYLINESSVADLRALAEQLAEWEWTAMGADLSEDSVDAVLASLLHCHLPKLADARLITFADESGEIALTATDGLVPILDEAARIECRASHIEVQASENGLSHVY